MGKFYNIIDGPEGKSYECNWCEFKSEKSGVMLAHHNARSGNRCSGRDWDAESKGIPAGEGVYKDVTDTNRVLEQILTDHPDITSKHTKEIMSWAELKGQLHPFEVAHLLTTMKGITARTANILSQKYQVAMQKGMGDEQTQFPASMTFGQPQNRPFGIGLGGPSSGYPPSVAFPQSSGMGGFPNQFLTKDEFLRLSREQQEASKLDKIEQTFTDSITQLREDLTKQIESNRPQVEKNVIEEQYPIDADGKPCPPDQAVSIKYVTRPFIAGASEVDFFDKLIKLKKAGVLGDDKTLDKEDIRTIIKEEKPATETPAVIELRNKLQKTEDNIATLKDDQAKERNQNLINTISVLEKKIDSVQSNRIVEGYQDDSMRVIGQGINSLAEVIKKKEPVKVLKDVFMPQTPEVKVVEPGADQGLAERLPNEYVSPT